MEKVLSNEQWLDSQKNEQWFWQTMLEQGNPDQKHRNIYYKHKMEGRCEFIGEYIRSVNMNDMVVLDLGSGPEGFCHAIPGRIKIAVDPLMNKFRKMGFEVDANNVLAINLEAEKLASLFHESLDVVFCLNSIDHHQNPEVVMDNIFLALKPGGHAFILTDLRPVELLDAYHKLPLSAEDLDKWSAKFEVVRKMQFPHGPGNPLMQYCLHLWKK